MAIIPRRPLTALVLAVACAAALAQSPAREDTAAAPAASVRALDLGAGETRPLAECLRQDLGPLLASAQYRRAKDEPDIPKHSLTSVRRVAEALRAHRGIAYVALAERVSGGDGVELQALYVLEGTPIGGGATAAPAPAGVSGKAAVNLDLTGAPAKALVASLHSHLGALLPPAGVGSTTEFEDVIAALRGHTKVSFVMLTERRGETEVDRTRVFVVPDVLRISISDDAAPAAAGGAPRADAPEVELIPGEDGGPPMVKFEFDPEKYDVTKKK